MGAFRKHFLENISILRIWSPNLAEGTLNGTQFDENVGDDAHIVPRPYGTDLVC